MARRYVKDSALRRRLRRFPEELRQPIKRVLTVSAPMLANEIQTRAPKDEGAMAENVSWRVSRDGLSAQIGYSKRVGFKRAWKRAGFKSLWQEFGTRHHGAQPFIRPSYRALLPRILDAIDRAVNQTLRRASRY